MNERIKELAEQAGAEIYGHPDYATICVNGQDADALMKKFARLLIQECADVAEDYDGDHYVGTEIERHFGIKEAEGAV